MDPLALSMLQIQRQLTTTNVSNVQESSSILQLESKTQELEMRERVFGDAEAHHLYWQKHKAIQSELIKDQKKLFKRINGRLQDAAGRYRDQGASEPTGNECIALLSKAKELVNGIHARILRMQQDIKIKEEVIEAHQVALAGEKLKLQVLREQKQAQEQKCRSEMEEARNMYKKYKDKLHELEQLASSQVLGREQLSLASIGVHLDSKLKDAHATFLWCATHSNKSNAEVDPETCKRNLEELQRNYTRAHKRISEMVSEFDKAQSEDCLEDIKYEFIAKEALIPLEKNQ